MALKKSNFFKFLTPFLQLRQKMREGNKCLKKKLEMWEFHSPPQGHQVSPSLDHWHSGLIDSSKKLKGTMSNVPWLNVFRLIIFLSPPISFKGNSVLWVKKYVFTKSKKGRWCSMGNANFKNWNLITFLWVFFGWKLYLIRFRFLVRKKFVFGLIQKRGAVMFAED